MGSPYLQEPPRDRREVLRERLAKAEAELARTRDHTGRQQIEAEILRLQDELRRAS